MGYTHYWTFKKPNKNTKELEALYQRAIKDCNRVIKHYQKRFPKGNYHRLSGYSAHTSNYGGIGFNGVNGCEDFNLRQYYKQNFRECSNGIPDGFNFCKTNQRSYDSVVIACLAILKHYLGEYVDIDSDGKRNDWIDGVLLANKALRRTKNLINNPIVDYNPEYKLVN